MTILLVTPDREAGSILSASLVRAGREVRWEHEIGPETRERDMRRASVVVIDTAVAGYDDILQSLRSACPWTRAYLISDVDNRPLRPLAPVVTKPFDAAELAGLLVHEAELAVADCHARALEAEAANLSKLVEASFEAIIGLSSDGMIESWNPGAVATYGYSPDEALGKHISLLEPFDGAAHRPPLAERRQVEVLRRTKSGKEISVLASVARLSAPDGNGGFAEISVDISERKELQARVLLSENLASVGRLAAGIAHEINNPLTYVLGNIEVARQELDQMAQGSPPSPDLSSVLADAYEGATRVAEIVKDLKMLSRPQLGPLQPVSMTAVLDGAIKIASNEIRHRAVLVKDYRRSPFVLASEARLIQVFLNLLVNAAQAIPDGQAIANRIVVTVDVDANDRAVVHVRDTGAGIPPELLVRVFEPFVTTKPVGSGTGLGLSISRAIVTEMNGAISVQSTVGEGTTFTVVLPTTRDKGGSASRRPSLRASKRRGAVLIVDDDVMVGQVLKRLLGSEHDVTIATSGEIALDRLRRGNRFDVIFCDLMMPEMNGMQFFREVERLAPTIADRVYFLTGGTFSPEAREFMERFPDRRIDKPVDSKMLLELVGQHVG